MSISKATRRSCPALDRKFANVSLVLHKIRQAEQSTSEFSLGCCAMRSIAVHPARLHARKMSRDATHLELIQPSFLPAAIPLGLTRPPLVFPLFRCQAIVGRVCVSWPHRLRLATGAAPNMVAQIASAIGPLRCPTLLFALFAVLLYLLLLKKQRGACWVIDKKAQWKPHSGVSART